MGNYNYYWGGGGLHVQGEGNNLFRGNSMVARPNKIEGCEAEGRFNQPLQFYRHQKLT